MQEVPQRPDRSRSNSDHNRLPRTKVRTRPRPPLPPTSNPTVAAVPAPNETKNPPPPLPLLPLLLHHPLIARRNRRTQKRTLIYPIISLTPTKVCRRCLGSLKGCHPRRLETCRVSRPSWGISSGRRLGLCQPIRPIRIQEIWARPIPCCRLPQGRRTECRTFIRVSY